MNFSGVVGTGSNALNWYLSRLNELATEKYGLDYVFPLKVLKTEFRPINNELPHNLKKAADLLEPYFIEIEKMTASPYILANITLHEAVNKFSSAPTSQFINLEKVFENKLADNRKVLILGSSYTMQHDFLPNVIRQCCQRINVEQPSQELIKQIDQLRKLYYTGESSSFSREIFTELFDQYSHIDMYIFACTELSIALDDSSIKKKYQDKILDIPDVQCKLLVDSASNLND